MENDILIQETLQGLFNERMNRFDPESKLSLADTFACRTETDRRGSRITTVAKPVPSYIISRSFFGESEKSKPVINQLSHPEFRGQLRLLPEFEEYLSHKVPWLKSFTVTGRKICLAEIRR